VLFLNLILLVVINMLLSKTITVVFNQNCVCDSLQDDDGVQIPKSKRIKRSHVTFDD